MPLAGHQQAAQQHINCAHATLDVCERILALGELAGSVALDAAATAAADALDECLGLLDLLAGGGTRCWRRPSAPERQRADVAHPIMMSVSADGSVRPPRVGPAMGAGAIAGTAWLSAALEVRHRERGWDAQRAGEIVGTSAGAVLAAGIAPAFMSAYAAGLALDGLADARLLPAAAIDPAAGTGPRARRALRRLGPGSPRLAPAALVRRGEVPALAAISGWRPRGPLADDVAAIGLNPMPRDRHGVVRHAAQRGVADQLRSRAARRLIRQLARSRPPAPNDADATSERDHTPRSGAA